MVAENSRHVDRNIIRKTKTWLIESDVNVCNIGYATRDNGRKDMRVRRYGSGHSKTVSKNFIPKYIAVRGDNRDRVIMVPMPLSDYFYVGNGIQLPAGEMAVDLYGISVRGYSIPIDDGMSAYYVSFDNYVAGIPRNSMAEFTLAIAELTQYNLCEASDVRNIEWSSLRNVDYDVMQVKASDKEISSLRDLVMQLNASKVTSAHHIHYLPEEIIDACSNFRKDEVTLASIIAKMPDAHKAALSGFILWFNTLSDFMLRLVSSLSCWNENSLSKTANVLKKSVRAAKLLQNNTALDLLPIFEAEVLINRGIGAVDWQQERNNRMKPDVVNISDNDVYTRALNIMQQGKHDRGKYPSMSWDKYWATRWQFTPTGSIKSQHKHDLEGLPADFRLKNKFVALNTTDTINYDDWITRRPSIHAWSSVKYEWGKERAIYGCDLTNFVLTNFAMYRCEDRLPPKFPVGSRAEPAYVTRTINGVLTGAEAFCFDFEDFNSQHSTGSMKSVLRAFADTYSGEMTTEQKQAMAWTIASVDDMIVHDNIGGTGEYKAKGTLFSGWRLTTFINSVLNAIYSEAIYEPTGAKHPMRSAHNGDDIILGVVNAQQAVGMLKNADAMNVRAQPSKCAFGAVAEFLRVDRQNGANSQYLPRAIATLVHSRIESGPSTTISESIRSNETRLSEYVERGGDLETAIRLRHKYIVRVSELYNTKAQDAYSLLRASSVVGGLSMARNAPVHLSVKDDWEETELEDPISGMGSGRSWRGVADMANNVMEVIGEAVGGRITVKDITKRVFNSTLKALSIRRASTKVFDTPNIGRARNWREHRGTFKNLRSSGTLGMARLAGVTIDLINVDHEEMEALLHKAAESSEPMGFISIAT